MGLIHNQAAADAIAASFSEIGGVNHPGNPDTKQPATTLKIPMFVTRGKPPPFADAIKTSNQTIAEAVIYLIEHQLHCTIIPTAELEALRQAAQPTTQ